MSTEPAVHTPTPLPWNYQEDSDAYTHIIRSRDREFVCQFPQDTTGNSEADARLVVLSVNAHDKLVEALRNLHEAAKDDVTIMSERLHDRLIAAAAALALAEGEK